MKLRLRIARSLFDRARSDLSRQHAFAAERVGFVYCRFATVGRGELLILTHDYVPVRDEHYIRDDRYGAVIDENAFRGALQRVYDQRLGAFHVHMHPHHGVPGPSRIDLTETAAFVPDFFHARPDLPHGAIVLSHDALSARVWLGENHRPFTVGAIDIVGAPLAKWEALDVR
jgi:hypothetical protein